MPITISYGNPALVGAASFAIGREKGKMKAGAKAADMAQGMLDRRDKKRDDERDRFDRLNKEAADRNQRFATEQGRLADSEADRQSRQNIATAKLNQDMQNKADRFKQSQNEAAQKELDDWGKRDRKRREDWAKKNQGGSDVFGQPSGEYQTPDWDPRPSGPSFDGMGGGGYGGMGGGNDFPLPKGAVEMGPAMGPGMDRGIYYENLRPRTPQERITQGRPVPEGPIPLEAPAGDQPPQQYGPIGGGEWEVEMGLTPEQQQRLQQLRTYKGQITSNPTLDYDQKVEALNNADIMIEEASVPQVVPKQQNRPKTAWEQEVFQTPQGPVTIGPDGMPTFMQGARETPEEKKQQEAQALGLAFANQMNPDGTPRYKPEEIPFAVASAMDGSPGERLKMPTPFEKAHPDYTTNQMGAYISPVMAEADAVRDMQGLDPEKYNVSINKSGDGRAQLTVHEKKQKPLPDMEKEEKPKVESRALSWEDYSSNEARRLDAQNALGGGENITQDQIDEYLEDQYDKYVERAEQRAAARAGGGSSASVPSAGLPDYDTLEYPDGTPVVSFADKTKGMTGSAPPEQKNPVLDSAIKATGGGPAPVPEAPAPAPEVPPTAPDQAQPPLNAMGMESAPAPAQAPAAAPGAAPRVPGPFEKPKPRMSGKEALGPTSSAKERDDYDRETNQRMLDYYHNNLELTDDMTPEQVNAKLDSLSQEELTEYMTALGLIIEIDNKYNSK